jgi:sortase (surface protein transpeptidase)
MPVQSGAPFKHIDRFRPGDLISIWTADGRFDYSVVSSGVTTPSDVPVIDQATAHGKADPDHVPSGVFRPGAPIHPGRAGA